eukprot:13071156-Alexandrium_andersonii.AAC.1
MVALVPAAMKVAFVSLPGVRPQSHNEAGRVGRGREAATAGAPRGHAPAAFGKSPQAPTAIPTATAAVARPVE